MTQPDDQPAPYGTGPRTPSGAPVKQVRVHHLQQAKERGERWAMLTAYDQYAAEVFDEAGIPVLLVGDSAGNNVLGYATTLPVTVDEMLPLVRAVTRTARRALVVADLPFGAYQASPEQALATGFRMMKEGLAHAVGSRAVAGWCRRSRRWSGPACPSWRTSASPRRASTRSAATGCRAAATTATAW
nr:3-methyl-2-oxobutanoate hydroxymethyltransferase [Angustibacter aerolatus]